MSSLQQWILKILTWRNWAFAEDEVKGGKDFLRFTDVGSRENPSPSHLIFRQYSVTYALCRFWMSIAMVKKFSAHWSASRESKLYKNLHIIKICRNVRCFNWCHVNSPLCLMVLFLRSGSWFRFLIIRSQRLRSWRRYCFCNSNNLLRKL